VGSLFSPFATVVAAAGEGEGGVAAPGRGSQVRSGLAAGGKWIRTLGPPQDRVGFRPPLLGAVKVPIPPQGPPLTDRNRTAAAIGLPRSPLLRLSMKLVPADFNRRGSRPSVRACGASERGGQISPPGKVRAPSLHASRTRDDGIRRRVPHNPRSRPRRPCALDAPRQG
jgi:hypothetical protein